MHPPPSSSLYPLGTTILLSVSVNVTILGTSCAWNPTVKVEDFSFLAGSSAGLKIKLTSDQQGKNKFNFIHVEAHKNMRLKEVTKAGSFLYLKQ